MGEELKTAERLRGKKRENETRGEMNKFELGKAQVCKFASASVTGSGRSDRARDVMTSAVSSTRLQL